MKGIIWVLVIGMFLTTTNGLLSTNNVVATSTNDLSHCFSQGPGDIIANISGLPACACLAPIDYNNDGYTDFIAGTLYQIFLYVNENGKYHPWLIYELPDRNGYSDDITGGGVTVGDFNNDGFQDFITGGLQGIIRLFTNHPSLSFRPKFDVSVITEFGQVADGLTCKDFNKDGNLDFAVSYADSPLTHSTISIYFNDGNGRFPEHKDVYTLDYDYITSLDSADYNNDGNNDLIFSYSICNQQSQNIYGVTYILFNDGNNNFNNATLIVKRGSGIPGDPEGRINPHTTSADYDKNGSIDLIIGDNSGKIEIFENNGNGNFTSIGIINDFGSCSWGLASADFNKDGDIDFLVAADFETPHGRIYLKHNLLVPFSIQKPQERHLYILDRAVFHHLHNTIVLGKITIEINQQKELNKVEFYVDNKLKYIDYNQSYQWQWDSKDPGRHTIEIITYDGEGNTVEKEMTAWKFF